MKHSKLLLFTLLAIICPVCQLQTAHAEITYSGDIVPADPNLDWGSGITGYIGQTTGGSLFVGYEDHLYSGSAYIGYGSGAFGMVTLGGVWSNNGDLIVGHYGTGELRIGYNLPSGTAGFLINAGYCWIGSLENSTGMVNVSGPGALLESNHGLYVGYEGTGELGVTAGGLVWAPYGCIGYGSGSRGSAIVRGSDSTWYNGGDLDVGGSGTGELDITGGGAVSSQRGRIGSGSGSTGTVTVSGGSTWENRASLTVGGYGTGGLSIAAGGDVSNPSGYVGSAPGSTGTVTVSGTGSTWDNSDELCVGVYGTGELNITGGGAVTVEGQTWVAREPGSSGTISFNNGTLTTGSLWAGSSQLTGTGIINTNGWIADGVDLVFDATHGSQPTIILNDPGQNIVINLEYDNLGILGAGYAGSGTLAIRDAVTVESEGGCIGCQPGSTGTATVSGIGSTWDYGGSLLLEVGSYGAGELTISDGGVVRGHIVRIGRWPGSTGTVTVSGTGSTLDNSGELFVGGYDTGELSISDGGAVTASEVGITGTLAIDCSSTLESDDYLSIGPGSHYTAGVGGPEGDLVTVAGHAYIFDTTLSVSASSSLTYLDDTMAWGDQTRTVLSAGGTSGITGTFASTQTPYTTLPNEGDYLGYGVWFGNQGGIGVTYVGAPSVVTAVDIGVYQAKAGDTNGDLEINFSDFNDLANNYTGALAPGTGGKEWRQGDFNGDADVDFGDFNDLANGYTGAGVEYGPGKAPATNMKATPGKADLIVYLADVTGADGLFHAAGDVVLSVDGGVNEPGIRLNGYEIYSASGSLVLDAGGVPYPFLGGAYMEESSTGIVVFGGLTSPLHVSGHKEWTLGWEFDVQAKATPDLEFSYGTSAGVISGNVLYVVPEPATITLLLLAFGAMVLLRRKSL